MVHDPAPGWGRFLLKLVVANAAMAAVLLFGLCSGAGLDAIGAWSGLAPGALVAGGGLAYALAAGAGFRRVISARALVRARAGIVFRGSISFFGPRPAPDSQRRDRMA